MGRAAKHAEPTTKPSRHTGAKVAGVFGTLVATAVVACAGVGGWFAVDQFLLPQLDASAAPAEPSSVWPVSYPADTTFDAFTMTEERDGQVTHTLTNDPATLRTRLTVYAPGGGLDHVTEVAGLEFWRSSPTEPEWRLATDDEAANDAAERLTRVRPVHIDDVVPPAAAPFVTVTPEDSAGGLDRYRVSVDVVAFNQNLPHEFEDWNRLIATRDQRVHEWAIEVRPDGYIGRWEGRSGSIQTWEDPTDVPVFESPLLARKPQLPDQPITDPAEFAD